MSRTFGGIVAVVALCCASTAAAQNDSRRQPPPSKTLERATALYDSGDFLSASIELSKVVNRETQDSEAHIQRAEFYLGKTLFQLDLYVPALARFGEIASAGAAHRYYSATLPWLAALDEYLPAMLFAETMHAYVDDFDDPTYDGARDQISIAMAKTLMIQGPFVDGAALLESIPQSSPRYVEATMLLGMALYAFGDRARAIEVLERVPADSEHAAEALRTLAKIYYLNRDDRARETYERAGAAGGDHAQLARIEAFLLVREEPHSLARADLHLLRELAVVDYCASAGSPVDVFAGTRDTQPSVRAFIDELLDEHNDGERYRRAVAELAGDDPDRGHVRAMVRAAIGVGRLGVMTDLIEAIDRQRAVAEALAEAWRSSEIAGRVETELALQRALAEAALGNALRHRMKRMREDLPLVVDAPAVIAEDLGLTYEMCPDGPPDPPADPEVPVVMREDPDHPGVQGPDYSCAGCATGAGGAQNVVWLAVVALLVARRRRRDDI